MKMIPTCFSRFYNENKKITFDRNIPYISEKNYYDEKRYSSTFIIVVFSDGVGIFRDQSFGTVENGRECRNFPRMEYVG